MAMRPLVVVFGMLLASLPVRAQAAPGVLDPTFGTGGITLVEVDGEGTYASALQPDGKVVSVGNVNLSPDRQLVVVRYTADGALDDSFGSGGISVIPAAAVGDPQPHGIVVLPDGKLLISAILRTAPGPYTTGLVRLASDGSLDTGFGTGGVVVQGTAGILVLATQPDGKILTGGNVATSVSPFQLDFAVARYDADGVIDPSFGTAGVATADFTNFDLLNGLSVSPDGRIVAVGSTSFGPAQSQFGIARWLADGTPDPGFGIGGKVLLPIVAGGYDIPYAAAPGPGGGLVVVGFGGVPPVEDMAIVELDASGSSNGAFAGDGIVTLNFGDSDIALATLVEPTGGVVVAGNGTFAGDGPLPNSTADDVRPVLLRYRSNGTLDPTFGVGGFVKFTVPGIYNGQFRTVLRLPDGRLIAAGYVNSLSGDTFFVVARYLNGVCGNGILEPGEDCDDGNTLAGDCCSPTCTFESAGSPCADDGIRCTTDECDGGGACVHEPAIRSSCRTPTAAGAAALQVIDKPSSKGDQIVWKWRKGAQVGAGELLEPFVAADYTLCGFDGSSPSGALLFESTAPGGGTCRGEPCWNVAGTDKVRYRNPDGSADGAQQVLLKPGPVGKAQASMKAKGAQVHLPSLPLPASVIVQLQVKNGLCFEARYSPAGTKLNDTTRFKARSD